MSQNHKIIKTIHAIYPLIKYKLNTSTYKNPLVQSFSDSLLIYPYFNKLLIPPSITIRKNNQKLLQKLISIRPKVIKILHEINILLSIYIFQVV